MDTLTTTLLLLFIAEAKICLIIAFYSLYKVNKRVIIQESVSNTENDLEPQIESKRSFDAIIKELERMNIV